MSELLYLGELAEGSGAHASAEGLRALWSGPVRLMGLWGSPRPPRLLRPLVRGTLAVMRVAWARLARPRPRVVFVMKNAGAPASLLKAAIGGAWVNWCYDDLWPRGGGGAAERRMRRDVAAFDRYGTTRRPNVLELMAAGAPEAMFVPFCAYPAMRRGVGARARRGTITVVANPERERADALRALVAATPRGTVRLVGHWEREEWSRLGADVVGPVAPAHVPCYLGPGVASIGFLRKRNRDDLNPRVFELLATGSHALFEDSEAVRAVAGDRARYWRTTDELVALGVRFVEDGAGGAPAWEDAEHGVAARLERLLDGLT